ncbi:MAG: DMT family transporter [Caulobacteraceae bacterium]
MRDAVPDPTLEDDIDLPAAPEADNAALGIGLRIAAMVCMAGLGALVKWCAMHGVPVLEIIFFRNAFAFIPVGAYIFGTKGLSVLYTARPMAHFTRAGIGLVGMTCGFTATAMLPLAQATAISFAAPLFMVGLSAWILKEKVERHRWAAVAVGFVGVLIMLNPETAGAFSVGVLFALAGAVGSAGAVTTIREIGKTESGPTIVFYFTLAGTLWGLASLPIGLLFPQTGLGWVVPNLGVLAGLIAAGVVGGIGQLLHTQALKVAPVAVVAPFDYTQLLWAAILGYLIWDDTPSPTTLTGAAVVAASGVYILWRETRKK